MNDLRIIAKAATKKLIHSIKKYQENIEKNAYLHAEGIIFDVPTTIEHFSMDSAYSYIPPIHNIPFVNFSFVNVGNRGYTGYHSMHSAQKTGLFV